jgi:hypothetical protein
MVSVIFQEEEYKMQQTLENQQDDLKEQRRMMKEQSYQLGLLAKHVITISTKEPISSSVVNTKEPLNSNNQVKLHTGPFRTASNPKLNTIKTQSSTKSAANKSPVSVKPFVENQNGTNNADNFKASAADTVLEGPEQEDAKECPNSDQGATSHLSDSSPQIKISSIVYGSETDNLAAKTHTSTPAKNNASKGQAHNPYHRSSFGSLMSQSSNSTALNTSSGTRGAVCLNDVLPSTSTGQSSYRGGSKRLTHAPMFRGFNRRKLRRKQGN